MNTILHSFTYSIDFLEDQVADIPDGDLTALPKGVPNHPLWTMGHLVYALDMLGTVIDIPSSIPEAWVGSFGSGSVPVEDKAAYASKETVLTALRKKREEIITAVRGLSDDQLDAEFPDPLYRDIFPTVRHALTQVLIGHTAFHVGQISVWRRAMKLPGIGRSYE